MNVMLLAAGEGRRLRPITETTPKPLVPFLGVPMLCYPLRLLDRIPIQNLVVNSHHLEDKLQAGVRKLRWPCKQLHFSSEATQLLDSGGGVQAAWSQLRGNGTVVIANSDEIILPHQMGAIEELLSYHRWSKGIASLLTMDHPGVGSEFGGAWCEPQSDGGFRVREFSKKPIASRTGLHYLGILAVEERISRYFSPQIGPANLLYDILTRAIQANELVSAFKISAEWVEAGKIDLYTKEQERLQGLLNSTPSGEGPYWLEHLRQVISLDHSRI